MDDDKGANVLKPQQRWQTRVLIRAHHLLAMGAFMAIVTLSWADQILKALPLRIVPDEVRDPSVLIRVAVWFVTRSPGIQIGIFVASFAWYLYANLQLSRLSTEQKLPLGVV